MTQSELMSVLRYDPDSGIFYWLNSGKEAGSVNSHGYVQIKINNTFHKAHRLAFLYMEGVIPDFVDHEDTDKTNNRWGNLRAATQAQNNCNVSRRKDNTSGVKGVSLDKRSGKWQANVQFNGVKYGCGAYFNIEDAEKAVIQKRNELHGAFANHK